MDKIVAAVVIMCISVYGVQGSCTPEIQAEILPCTCYNATLNCSAVTSAEELSSIQLTGNWDQVYLQNSPIDRLPSDGFGSVHAASFFLDHNQISVVEDGFLGGSDPDELDLSDNFLTDLPYDYLKTMNNMIAINVARNQLTRIPVKAFENVGRLEAIFLSENQINSLGWRAFIGQPNLQHIGLSSNNLTELANYAFIKTTRVNNSYLDLSTNHISQIHPLAFGGEYFDIVNLMYNFIDEMQRLTFEKMIVYMATSYLQPKIHMTGNPLSCNCTAKWLFSNGEDYGVYYEQVVPAFPCQEYGGIELWDLPEDSFDHCPCME